jgi:hypothetical protein
VVAAGGATAVDDRSLRHSVATVAAEVVAGLKGNTR